MVTKLRGLAVFYSGFSAPTGFGTLSVLAVKSEC